jgi:hypothetical protein
MDKPLMPKSAAQEIPLHQDLRIGAEALALEIYGEDTDEAKRDIYRNPMNLPFFKHGNFIAGLVSEIRAAIRERQREAKEEAEQKQKAKKAAAEKQRARINAKLHRRRRACQTEHAE